MIPLFKVHMPEDLSPVIETMRSGYVTQGPRVEEFEGRLRELLGTEHVLALNSGTSALTLAYRLAGVGPGTRVITTPMTCTATNLPILTAGAEPIFADVNPHTGLIDLDSVRKILRSGEGQSISRPIRAIVGVDWGGAPCNHSVLAELGLEYGVPFIADSAHSLGAIEKINRVGSVADMTCFSLQAIKHITTIDGGILSFGPHLLAESWYSHGKLLRWYGIDREEIVTGDSRIDVDILEAGYKFHMNDVAASLGLLQLPYLGHIVLRHRLNAMAIHSSLDQYFAREWVEGSVHWVATVLLPDATKRDEFRKFMLENGVQVSRVHRRNDEYTVFRPFARSLPGLDEFSSRMICLPCHWALSSEDLDKVIDLSNAWARSKL